MPQILRLRGGGAGFVGFGGQNLLLRYGFGLGLLGLIFLARGFLRGGERFLLHALGFGFRLFGGGAGLLGLPARLRSFGIGAALGFGIGVGAGFGFAGCSGGLGFVLGLLFDSHQAGFFGGFGGFLGGGFDRGLVLLLAVDFLGVQQLLSGFRHDRRRVLVGGRDVRDAYGIARFEQFQRSLAVDSENCVLNVGVGRRICTAGYQFVSGVDILASAAGTLRFPSPPCCRAASRRNRVRR